MQKKPKSPRLSVNEDFTQFLQCPICCEFYRLPIYLCDSGHSICSDCAIRMQRCPTCRASINKQKRNYILEQQMHSIEFHCLFDGCNAVVKLANKVQHELQCPFNPNIRCLLNCKTFLGTRPELFKHIQDVHNVPHYDIYGNEAEFSSRLRPETSAPLSGCVKLLHTFHKASQENVYEDETHTVFTYLYMDANKNLLYPQLRTFDVDPMNICFKLWNIDNESEGYFKLKSKAPTVVKSLEEERQNKNCVIVDLESVVNKYAFMDRAESDGHTRLLHFKIKLY